MNLTPEQSDIVAHFTSSEGLTMVSAVAGAGKTTLLVSLANSLPHSNGLYLAFNKKIATEAKSRFPSTTHCCTTHSFAYGPTVVDHKLKLGLFTYRQVLEPIPYERKCELVDLINQFCLSEFTTFSDFVQDPQLTSLANKYLSLMQSGSIECTHAFYLKYFHILLASNHLSYEPFDFIMLDESGDLNPVTLAIFNLLPSSRKIMVGDACMPGDIRIKTVTGWKRLGSIVKAVNSNKSISVWSYNHTTNTFEFKPVIGAISTGVKQCYLLKTTRSSVECTANHKVATPDGYKRLDELSVGDLVIKDGDSCLGNTKTTLNRDQYQVLLGSYLGDGCIKYQDNARQVARLSLGHSIKQLNYLNWKASAFNAISTISSEARHIKIQGSDCYTSEFYTACSKLFVLPRTITIESIKDLSPLGLAIWVMDDGSLRNSYSSTNTRLSITIDSNAFNSEENTTLQAILKSNFGLCASIQKTRSYYRLSFDKANSLKLLAIIAPYVGDDFLGKFKHTSHTPIPLDNSSVPYTVDVITAITPTRVVETFDIEVRDNHNFIASKTAQKSSSCGILVHNCQNIYGFNHTINCFEVMKHSGTTFPMSQSFRVSDLIASRIQTFCRRYLDPNMNFVGIPATSSTIHSRAYISRTNSQLVSKMMELNKLGTPYSLTRPAKQIFRVPLLVCGLKPGGFIPDPEYKHLQVDVDTYAKSATLQRLYSSLFSYLKELHADDSALQTAMSTVVRYGAKAIIECFNEAKRHEHSRSNYTLTTSHACKGLEFCEVEIADDLNKSIKPLLELTDFDSEQQAELNLYYVAVSRARINLINSLI